MQIFPHCNLKTLKTLDTRGIHPLTLLKWELQYSHPALLHDIKQYYTKLLIGRHKKDPKTQASNRNICHDLAHPPKHLIELHRQVTVSVERKVLIKFKYPYSFAQLQLKRPRRRSSFAIHDGNLYKLKTKKTLITEQLEKHHNHSFNHIHLSHW